MTKWYVEEVYTPDDTDNDRTRRYGEFEADKKTPVKDLAVLAMMQVGWDRGPAERQIKDDADLEGTTIEDGAFDFVTFGNNGEYSYTVSQEPIPKPAAYVVMVNNQPVAVRPWTVSEKELGTIAARLKLPVESLSVTKVDDVVG